jgi:hypothetical protein
MGILKDKPESDAAGPKGSDRRQWQRHPLRDARGTLSWQEDGETVSCDATVDNISGGGVAVRVEREPRGVHQVRLHIDSVSASTQPWISELVGSSREPSGSFALRLKFTHWIPLDSVLDKHRERRMWQRYPANEIPMTLTWEENEKEVTVTGELVNISGGGAALIIDVHPPFNRGMWLELKDRSHMIEPVESRLVVVSDDPSGVKIARLWFVGPCSLELFEIARQGGVMSK